MTILELGTSLTDKITQLKGSLTVLEVDMSHNVRYVFQPKGVNSTTKQPLEVYWLEDARVQGGKKMEIELPVKVLGTEVEDTITGFKGFATALSYHINGCIHLEVKPAGAQKGTGESFATQILDIRRCKGKAITALSKAEKAESQKQKPSPVAIPSHRNR